MAYLYKYDELGGHMIEIGCNMSDLLISLSRFLLFYKLIFMCLVPYSDFM